MIPIQGVAPECFHQIGLPQDFAGEIQRRKITALEINEDALAVRDG